jgi:hypothetical protein
LEKAQDERLALAVVIQKFSVDFLAAMKGRFGASSQIAKNCPVVTKRRQSGGRAAGTEKWASRQKKPANFGSRAFVRAGDIKRVIEL